MEKHFTEGLSNKLGNKVKSQIKTFFEQPPKEQIESLKKDLEQELDPKDPLRLLFEKISKELIEEIDHLPTATDHWNRIEENLWSVFDFHFQVTFHHYLRFSLLFCLLSESRSNVFDKKYLRKIKKEFDLHTSGKLQKALMKTLDKCFFDEIKRGGKKAVLDDGNKLKLLALYNRYSIIIKYARREFKLRKKKDKTIRDAVIMKSIAKKFKIPEIHIESLFSFMSVSETALDWAKQTLKLNLSEEYLKDLMTEARNKWKTTGLIIDCRLKPGKVFYTIDPLIEKNKLKLKFTSEVTVPLQAYNNNSFVESPI